MLHHDIRLWTTLCISPWPYNLLSFLQSIGYSIIKQRVLKPNVYFIYWVGVSGASLRP